jgi:glycosyltransferase involved in cell wall biosynthesis
MSTIPAPVSEPLGVETGASKAALAARKDAMELTILLVTSSSSEFDGIADYTQHLAQSLGSRPDVAVQILDPRKQSLAHADGGDAVPRVVLVQYNPFNFGRWGFAPWLPYRLWRLRRCKGVTVALMVHETFMPVSNWRTAIMGAWQRIQFAATHAACHIAFTSISSWAEMLGRRVPRRPVFHLPVGSNLPDMRADRASVRAELGADSDAMVLAAFGSNHPSRLMDYVQEASTAIGEAGQETLLLNLGANVLEIDLGPNVRVITPGRLAPEEVSRYLAATDLYLAPFIDGVSTRRTTLMAALQHGLPVVGTDGHLTDPLLREPCSPIALAPVGDREGFVRVAARLAADPTDRSVRAARARELYEAEFEWSIISALLVSRLRDVGLLCA